MAPRFEQQTVLITGASKGIGAACARAFAAAGADLVLVARTPGPLEALAEELRGERKVTAVPMDVADEEALEALVEKAVEQHGGIDVVVNNAGANARGPFVDIDAGALGQMVDVNLRAPIVLTRHCLPHLMKSTAGCVVNVASLAGRVPLAHEAVYSATKFGLRTLSFALADELRDAGVRVAVVSPGPVQTTFILEDLDEVPDIVLSQPMDSPQRIAELVLEAAAGGKTERTPRRLGATMTTLGYLFPPVRRVLRPVMERVGRARKERLRK